MPAGAVAFWPTTPGYHMVTIQKAGFSLRGAEHIASGSIGRRSRTPRFSAAWQLRIPRLRAITKAVLFRSVESCVSLAVDLSDADFASNLSVVPLPLDKSILSGPGRRPDGAEGAAPAGLRDSRCRRRRLLAFVALRTRRGSERQPA